MISPTIPWHIITVLGIAMCILGLLVFYLIIELKNAREKHDDRTVKVIENHVKYTAVLERVLLGISVIKDELKDELRENRRQLLEAIKEYTKRQ